MKKSTFFLVLFSVTLFPCVYAQSITAREIVDKQEDIHSAQREYTLQRMILVDNRNNREIRNIREYSMDFSEDHSRFLIVFDSPQSVRGTALLTWWNRYAESDQWMYLPAQRRMQRIAEGSKKGYFMGSDFTFEDMQPENLDNFQYKILKETTFSEMPCWVIEVIPVSDEIKKASGYSRRILYILKDFFFTVKIEFYDKWDVLIKTQQNGLLKKIDDTRLRSNKIIMVNHKTNHKTIIETLEREIDKEMDQQVFTERYITSGRHLP